MAKASLPLLHPGETSCFTCAECDTEFDITLEPKAKDNPESASMEAQTVVCCPFCAGELACDEPDEDEEEEDEEDTD